MNAEHSVCLGPPVLASATRIAKYSKLGLWGNQSLPSIFYRHADTRGDLLALTDCLPGVEETRDFTYCEADLAIRHLAARFDSCGLKPGDIVALQLPPGIEATTTTIACMGLGFIVCSLPMAWRQREIEEALSQIGARAIVSWSDGEQCERVLTACSAAFRVSSIRYVFAFGAIPIDGVTPLRLEAHDDAERFARALFPLTIDPNALALITWDMAAGTGRRAVARSHNECVAAGLATVVAAALRDGATILSPYLLSGLAGVAAAFVPWLMTGGLLALHRPFDLARWTDQAIIFEPDFAPVPAPLATALSGALTERGITHPVLGLVREAGSAATPVLPSSAGQRAVDLLCIGDIAMIARRLDRTSDLIGDELPLGAIACGPADGPKLLHSKCADSADNTGTDAKSYQIAGPSTPSAILSPGASRFGLSSSAPADEFVPSGLCVHCDFDSESLCVIAPDPDIAHVGAVTVSLSELDGLYGSCEAFEDAAAVTIDDPILGARLVAAVVSEQDGPDLRVALAAHIRRLGAADFKAPDRLVTVSAIARDAAGRPDRNALRRLL